MFMTLTGWPPPNPTGTVSSLGARCASTSLNQPNLCYPECLSAALIRSNATATCVRVWRENGEQLRPKTRPNRKKCQIANSLTQRHAISRGLGAAEREGVQDDICRRQQLVEFRPSRRPWEHPHLPVTAVVDGKRGRRRGGRLLCSRYYCMNMFGQMAIGKDVMKIDSGRQSRRGRLCTTLSSLVYFRVVSTLHIERRIERDRVAIIVTKTLRHAILNENKLRCTVRPTTSF